jgi:hypothetical protein
VASGHRKISMRRHKTMMINRWAALPLRRSGRYLTSAWRPLAAVVMCTRSAAHANRRRLIHQSENPASASPRTRKIPISIHWKSQYRLAGW